MTNHPTPKDGVPTDLLDIIFQNRNREYGAYQLRKLYDRYLTRGGLLTIALSVLLSAMPTILKWAHSVMPQEKLNDRIVHLSEPPPLDPKTVPPPMPPVVPPPARPIIIFIIPKVIEDEKVMDEAMPPTQDEMKAVDISTKTQDGVENGISEGIGIEPQEEELPPVVEVPVIKKDEVFIIVEQMPKYDGGDKAFADFLRENLIYPLMARENGIEGTVVIRFIVNMDGSIVEPRIARDVAGGCGEEALRVVKAMPKWQPGKQRGVPVRVQFNLPIKFKLQQ